jgi:tetratricopeptide (TPR) repeat protein
MHKFCSLFLCAVIGILLLTAPFQTARAQSPMPTPQASPKATVSQTVGLADVTVSYHRPGVKDRAIWGGLVKYGQIWRAGANENTTVTFSDAVKVEGKDLAAGTYGFHVIPTDSTWTVIFSNNSTSWGSYFYNQSEDALRLTVKPQPAESVEWLAYYFGDLTNNSAVLCLHWEKLRLCLKLEFDTDGIFLSRARTSYLRSGGGFSWQNYNQAAAYCLRRGTNLDEALMWANKSIGYNENFTNSSTKADLLDKLGKKDEATKVRDRLEALAVTEQDLNNLGYSYLNANKTKEGLELLKKNAKMHPNSANVYDSLGEAYAKSGDKKLAIENYNKALSLAQDDDARGQIKEALQKLQAK